MASPRPVPPYFREMDVVSLDEGLEDLLELLRCDADAGVGDLDSDGGFEAIDGVLTDLLRLADAHHDLTPLRELDGVGDEIR